MTALLFALSQAIAAPGQSGVVYPSAVPPDHVARAGLAGGFTWVLDGDVHGLTALDVSLQPMRGVQISSMVSLQADGRARLDPGFVVVTATLPTRSNVKLAASVGAGSFLGRHGAAAGVVLGNHSGDVGWDLGAYPLTFEYTPDWGWAEVEGGDTTPAWDLRPQWRTVTAGLDFRMSDHWRVRLGVPDGFTFSFTSRRFYLDFGGGSAYVLAGGVYLKSGVRI
ncbi:MAG: hypothetical protein R3F61_26420 [Myxococcota bacterium]